MAFWHRAWTKKWFFQLHVPISLFIYPYFTAGKRIGGWNWNADCGPENDHLRIYSLWVDQCIRTSRCMIFKIIIILIIHSLKCEEEKEFFNSTSFVKTEWSNPFRSKLRGSRVQSSIRRGSLSHICTVPQPSHSSRRQCVISGTIASAHS
jgi:hypothetical protein